MFWYWFLMIPICYADPYILLIGGDRDGNGNGTIEEFDPNTMTSKRGVKHDALIDTDLDVAPLNDTHAILSDERTDAKTYYIDINGEISPGPEKNVKPYSDIVSQCDKNGRRQVIICGKGKCQVLSADGRSFDEHSSMTELDGVFTLTAFGKELIAVGVDFDTKTGNSNAVERYDGSKWKRIEYPYDSRVCSAAVKLNDDQLLSCGGGHWFNANKCYVYNLGNDTWIEGPDAKLSICMGQLAMVGHTVYAFGGRQDGTTVQTLDVSNGIEKAEWKLETAKLKMSHTVFGIWIVDGSNICQTTTTGKPMVTDGQGLGDSATVTTPRSIVTDSQGLDDETTVTTSGSMVTGVHLLGMILMALLVFTYCDK